MRPERYSRRQPFAVAPARVRGSRSIPVGAINRTVGVAGFGGTCAALPAVPKLRAAKSPRITAITPRRPAAHKHRSERSSRDSTSQNEGWD
jgi:hypothetical protein